MSGEEQGDQYELATLLRRITSVAEPAMRMRQVQRHIASVDPETAAAHFQEVLRRSLRGDGDAAEVMLALSSYLDVEEPPQLDAIDLAARREGHHGVAWLLLNPPPARETDLNALRLRAGRGITLGERKAAARGWDRQLLERLLMDVDPSVIDLLCANTRLGEQHVLSVVSRRPTNPEVIQVVARHPRWYARARIREGIAQNPYGPTGLALRTLPLVSQRTIERVAVAGDLHPTMKEFARYLVSLRSGEADGPAPGARDEG